MSDEPSERPYPEWCAPGLHEWDKDYNGFRFCKRCGWCPSKWKPPVAAGGAS